MQYLFINHFAIANVLVYAIIGGLAALLGYAVILLIRKFTNTRRDLNWVMIVFVILATAQFGQSTVESMKTRYAANLGVEKLKELRLYSVIFKNYPGSESELKSAAREILKKSSNNNDVIVASQIIGARFVEKYLNQSLPNAADDKVYKFMETNYEMNAALKESPQACIAFSLGMSSPELNQYIQQHPEKLNQLSEAKADIIESAFTSPSKLTEMKQEDVVAKLKEAYLKAGFTEKDIKRLETVGTLQQDEQCQVMIDFAKSLNSLDTHEASTLFKNLSRLSALQAQKQLQAQQANPQAAPRAQVAEPVKAPEQPAAEAPAESAPQE